MTGKTGSATEEDFLTTLRVGASKSLLGCGNGGLPDLALAGKSQIHGSAFPVAAQNDLSRLNLLGIHLKFTTVTSGHDVLGFLEPGRQPFRRLAFEIVGNVDHRREVKLEPEKIRVTARFQCHRSGNQGGTGNLIRDFGNGNVLFVGIGQDPSLQSLVHHPGRGITSLVTEVSNKKTILPFGIGYFVNLCKRDVADQVLTLECSCLDLRILGN